MRCLPEQREGPPRRLRIGMLTDLYHPHVSGVTIHIDQVKSRLERWGHTVRVFAYGASHPEEEERGVVRSPSLPWGMKYGREKLAPGVWLTARARGLLESMDVIHVHHPFPAGLLAWRCSERSGKALVFTCHTRYDLHLKAVLPRGIQVLAQAATRTYLRRFCGVCDALISPSHGMRQLLRSWGIRGSVEVVPHGLDPAPFQLLDRKDERARLGFSPGDVVIVYTGRLGKEKDLDTLITAFHRLVPRLPGVRLAIVGDGPERGRLSIECRGSDSGRFIRFTGTIPHPEIPRWLCAADIFATPSKSEVYPISVLEARVAGLPVVGFQAPGLEEIVIDGRHGFLAGDTSEFESCLRRLSADADLRRTLATASRVDAAAFHEDTATLGLMRLYRRLGESGRPVTGERMR